MQKLMTLVTLALVPVSALASTGFRVGSGASGKADMYAISTGWYSPVEAAALVNARNVHRTPEKTTLEWDSRFGSVSITMRGIGYPMSGVNEKGLVIQATILKDKPRVAAPQGGFGLESTPWLQYQLDMSASVDEVIDRSVTSKAPVVGVGTGTYNTQFEVCDSKQCATVSFHDGLAVAEGPHGRIERVLASGKIHRDAKQTIPFGAIANREVSEAMAIYEKCKNAMCEGLDSIDRRFVIAAKAAVKYAAKKSKRSDALVREVFTDLATLDQGAPLTTWNELFDFDATTGTVRIFYKSPKRAAADLQWITVKSDYDCHEPIAMWWLDMSHAGGDQTPQKKTFDRDAADRLSSQHLKEKGGVFEAEQVKAFRDNGEMQPRCASVTSGPSR